MKYFFYLIWILLFFGSCQNEQSKKWSKEIRNDRKFPNIRMASEISKDLNSIISIDEWCLNDSVIICKSSLTDNFFHVFNLSNLTLRNSFGTKGNGPNEWIAPHLFIESQNDWIIIDNGKKECFILKNGKIYKKMPLYTKYTYSMPQIIRYPIIGVIENIPNKPIWKLQDIETGDILDSFSLTMDNTDNKKDISEFCWSISNNHIVFANLFIDQFSIHELNENKMINKYLIKGDGLISKNKCYYSDITCTDDCIYILSQKNVDISTGDGTSELEVYNYDGSPKELFKLNFIANKMLFDNLNKKMLFLSPLDDSIREIEI